MNCPIVSDIDRRLSGILEMTPEAVASLRGAYMDASETKGSKYKSLKFDGEHTPEEIEKIASALINFNRASIAKNLILEDSKLGSAQMKLQAQYSSQQRRDRENYIVTLFSNEIDNLQKKYPGRSREEICNGFIDDNGYLQCGEIYIFESILNAFRNTYTKLTAVYKILPEGDKKDKVSYLINEYSKLIDNFGAFASFARKELKNREGLILGNSVSYAKAATEGSYEENDISQQFNPEEAIKDGFLKLNDSMSPSSMWSYNVRRILETAPTGEKDDIGVDRRFSSTEAHQLLVNVLRGMVNSDHMMRKLDEGRIMYSGSRTGKLCEWLYDILSKNPSYRTSFFTDLKKNFCLYKSMTVKNDGTVRTFIKNKVRDLLAGSFRSRIRFGKTLGLNSIYDKNGLLLWDKVDALKTLANTWLKDSRSTADTSNIFATPTTYGSAFGKLWERGTSKEDRVKYISEMCEALGIDVDSGDLAMVLSNYKTGKEFTKNLYKAITVGLSALNRERQTRYITIYTRKANNGERNAFAQHINKALDILSTATKAKRIESRTTHKDSKGNTVTMYSDTYPSFLGDFVTQIHGFVEAYDGEGLRIFLADKYSGSMFRESADPSRRYDKDNAWRNTWLQEMWNDSYILDAAKTNDKVLDELDTIFPSVFNYSRMLVQEKEDYSIPFEDFTTKMHALQMMHEYLFAENLTYYKRDKDGNILRDEDNKPIRGAYGNYPVFIMGDSGVSKSITAKRYTKEEIIDGMVKIAQSEYRRFMLTEAMEKDLKKKGFSFNKNLHNSKNIYKMLPFLNDNLNKLTIQDGVPTNDSLRAVIRKHMQNSSEIFLQQMISEGVLEGVSKHTKEGSRVVPKYFQKEAESIAEAEGISIEDATKMLVEDFYYNTKFATLNQFQLMTIDVAFYKDTKDLQKRYKEIHAPGTSLDVSAVDEDGNLYCGERTIKAGTNDAEKIAAGIETAVYFDEVITDADEINPEFMAAVRNNLGRASSLYNALSSYKKNKHTDGQGYRSLDSLRRVLGMAGKWTRDMESAYKAIKAFESKWGDRSYEDVTDTDKFAYLSELEDITSRAVIFQSIKPYMYTFEKYDMQNDSLNIPVQHKYAEAVIIPCLLPKGKLRAMGEWMQKNNIDLVASTECVKVGMFGSTDISQAKNKDELGIALNKGYVHKLSYSDYKIQTNVPEHLNVAQLFGTQIKKLILGGIKLDSKHYGGYLKDISPDALFKLTSTATTDTSHGRGLANLYSALISANIIESFQEFYDLVQDPKALSAVLQQSVISNSRESRDNLLAYSLSSNGKDFLMPLFEGGLEHDSAAMLLSLFKNKVNKQRIKGGSAVQVSALGITGYEESENLAYVCSDKDGNIVRITGKDSPEEVERKLASITNVLYAECEVPFDLSVEVDGKEVPLKFSDWCDSDGNLYKDKDGVPLLEKKYPKILDRIAYRIPTEREYSMLNIKITRFSHKMAGGTIKVPSQGTTIAGFDYDIDKLYFMMREYVVSDSHKSKLTSAILKVFKSTEDESEAVMYDTYDPSKTPLENSRAARNNLLLDIIQARLEDPETLPNRLTPGGFPNSSNAARMHRELQYGDINNFTTNGKVDLNKLKKVSENKNTDPEPNYDPSDPSTILLYNQLNQIAAKLIGVFANQNTNHAFASLLQRFELTQSLDLFGRSRGDLLKCPDATDTALTLAEFLAASVDAVKDPVLNYLAFNTITANSAGLLARLGYTSFEMGLLFNQPAIKHLCTNIFNDGSNSMIDIEIDKYIKVLESKLKTKEDTNPHGVDFTSERLAESLLEYRKLSESNNTDEDNWTQKELVQQIRVLKQFKQIYKAAEEVNSFITATKFSASNAVSSTFGGMYNQQMKVQNYIQSLNSDGSAIRITASGNVDSPILDGLTTNFESLKGEEAEKYFMQLIFGGIGNPYAYEQAMYDMNKLAIKALNKYYPYDTPVYTAIRETARAYVRNGVLSEDTINGIHRDLLIFLLAQSSDAFNGTSACPYGGKNNRDYYLNQFPEEITRDVLLSEDKEKYAIFKYMYPEVSEDGTTSLVIQDVGGLTPTQKDEIRDSWTDLYADNSELAAKLFFYNYYKMGFTFSAISFMHLAPTTLKTTLRVGDTSYIGFLRNVLDGTVYNGISEDTIRSFLAQYVLNHSDNRQLVYSSKKFQSNVMSKFNPAEGSMSFTQKEAEDKFPELVLRKTRAGVYYRPCFKLTLDVNGEPRTFIYLAQGQDTAFNRSATGITYKLLNPDGLLLGHPGKGLSYTTLDPLTGNSIMDITSSSDSTEGSTGGDTEGIRIDESGVDELSKWRSLAERMVKAIGKSFVEERGATQSQADEWMSNMLSTIKHNDWNDASGLKAVIRDLKEQTGVCRDDLGEIIC